MSRWTGVLLTCAWVLWGSVEPTTMFALSAYETLADCNLVLDKLEKKSPTLKGQPIFRVCLPDTIDPRRK
jgi:hypothetical protein